LPAKSSRMNSAAGFGCHIHRLLFLSQMPGTVIGSLVGW